MSALTVRTSLRVDALDAPGLDAACTSHADAVLIDLASAAAYARRADARRAANHALLAIAATGRPVHARVSDTRSGETEGDIMSMVRAGLAAVVLAGAERPQDARDLDVLIRKQEMRRDIEPGSVRLVVELDSAAGIRALPGMLEAVDRHSAVTLDVSALAAALRLPGAVASQLPLLEHAMSEVALTCAAHGLPWTVAAPAADPGTRALLANRAHALGAAGTQLASEAEASGFTRLFTPPPAAVHTAHAILDEWARLVAAEQPSGVTGPHLVDRRTMRAARLVVDASEAIARRERVRR